MTNLIKVDPSKIVGTLTPIGWIPPDEPCTYKEWAYTLGTAAELEAGLPLIIGDLLNYGEARWGEKYTQAIPAFDRKYQTLANYASVAARIDFTERREKFGIGIYSAVAYLPHELIGPTLDVAESRSLTVDQTRALVRQINIHLNNETAPIVIDSDNGQFENALDKDEQEEGSLTIDQLPAVEPLVVIERDEFDRERELTFDFGSGEFIDELVGFVMAALSLRFALDTDDLFCTRQDATDAFCEAVDSFLACMARAKESKNDSSSDWTLGGLRKAPQAVLGEGRGVGL